jgi:serine/threonine protein kinase
MHIDYNQEERVLVYKYFRHTLLALIAERPHFPAAEVKKILRYTGEAIKEFHDKGWIHLGTMLCAQDIASSRHLSQPRCLARCETR